VIVLLIDRILLDPSVPICTNGHKNGLGLVAADASVNENGVRT